MNLLAMVIALTAHSAEQQQPPRPNQQNPFRPIIVIPSRDQAPPPQPKPPPPKPAGIEAPKPRINPRPNPTVLPGTPGMSETLDMSDWSKISPIDTGFTFHMPQEPEERTRKITAGERELDLVQYVYSFGDRGAYVVTYSDLPAGVSANRNGVFRGARDRVVSTLGGRLLTEEQVDVGGLPGIEVLIRVGEDNLVRQRMFVDGDRFFQAIAAGPREFIRSAQTEKYFRAIRFAQADDS